MNKTELVEAISASVNGSVSKKDIADVVNGITEAITNAVAKGDKVSLVGFGSFDGKKKAARTGRNPSTGKPLDIPAKVVPRFTAGKAFKDALNG